MAKRGAVEVSEVLTETLEFGAPLALDYEWLRADHQNGVEPLPRLEFLDDEAGLDGLADAYIIGDEQTGTVRIDEFHDRPILVRLVVDAAAVERVEAGHGRVKNVRCGEPRLHLLSREMLR